MYFNDHNPPHFHAKYEGSIAVFNIANRRMMAGGLPPNATRLVRKWAALHERELMHNWLSAKKDRKLEEIKPLE